MSFNQVQGVSGSAMAVPQFEEFTVRIPRDKARKFTMMKFGSGSSVDFSKVGEQPVKIERENNLREYKTANDLDQLPKFGAGSEYGRDQKEESRRKKYGIMLKRYNPEDQPWLLKIGSGKQAKKFKGVREGTIALNTSYYIFTKAADGAFEAFPVDEWYNFNPIVQYKYLNSEEAEELFKRRDETLNHRNIMIRKRLKKEDNENDEEEEGVKKGGKKAKKKNMILTDMEDWDDMQISDDDEGDDDDDGDKSDKEDKQAKKKKGKMGKKTKATKNSKKNSDDEAVEESDEGDYDDREVDYMSDSGSSDSLSGAEDTKDKKYQEKGVEEEKGLRNILDSDAEDEEEPEDKEELEEEIDEKEEKKDEKQKGSDESSSSSSEDDSDIEKDSKLASVIFLQKKEKKEKKEKSEALAADAADSSKVTNSSTAEKQQKEKGLKRKAEKTADGKPVSTKRHRSDECEGISEDAIRRYLMRKPMTTKDLLQKFRSKKLNMTNEKITHVIAQLLKKINPERKTINKTLYLSLKKPE